MVINGASNHKIDYVAQVQDIPILKDIKSQNWLKSYGHFAKWVNVAHWWSCVGKNLQSTGRGYPVQFAPICLLRYSPSKYLNSQKGRNGHKESLKNWSFRKVANLAILAIFWSLKVCICFMCRKKVCMAPFHVRSEVCKFSPHKDGYNADFSLHIERSHADFAPHMERRHS